jgi:5-formyltetrahydrofolate cyclo-ligase
MSKVELRSAMRDARKAFVASLPHSQRLELETRLAEHLGALVSQAKIVGSYHSHGSEIDPAGALQGAITAYPSFVPDEEKFSYRTGECVEAGPHKIMQPACSNPAVMPDLLLIPLIAIDRLGYRLGQGGGHYDRVLPALRAAGAKLIGVGWEMQRLDFSLPHERWDVALDGFASPRGLEMFR